MRDNVKIFVQVCSRIFSLPQPIFEIGSLQVPGQEAYADLRPFFEGKPYIGCDMRSGPGVDRIENAENLTMQKETVGTILMVETLEHVENPHRALDEIYRVLRKDGIAVITSQMNFPIHDYPRDFWRFAPEALNLLLVNFPIRIIGSQGHPLNPHTVFGIGFRSSVNDPGIRRFEDFYHCLLEELQKERMRAPRIKRILRQLFCLPNIRSYFPHFANEELSFRYIGKSEEEQSIRAIIR